MITEKVAKRSQPILRDYVAHVIFNMALAVYAYDGCGRTHDQIQQIGCLLALFTDCELGDWF